MGDADDANADLQRALEEAFAANRPALIVIPIDYAENNKLTEKLGKLTATL